MTRAETERRAGLGAPTFYYDFNSPYAWLAAERINQTMPQPPIWRPISFAHVIKETGRLPWSLGPEREEGIAEVSRRATERGLGTIKWPEGWPAQTSPLAGLRAATFAVEIGESFMFSLAAFRLTFLARRPMSQLDDVLLAGAACGLDPDAIKLAIERDSVKQRLIEATREAVRRGVTGVPTVAVGGELFWGDDRLEDAAEAARRFAA